MLKNFAKSYQKWLVVSVFLEYSINYYSTIDLLDLKSIESIEYSTIDPRSINHYNLLFICLVN